MTWDEKEYYENCCKAFIKGTKDKVAKQEVKELIEYFNKHNWNGKSPKKDEEIYAHMRVLDKKWGIF